MMDKSPDAFRTISEVAEDLDLPQHVLRFWETRFSQIKPLKRGGGRRYYRPDDIDLLRGIRHLLYGRGYTIKGVQRILKEEGLRSVQAIAREARDGAAKESVPNLSVPAAAQSHSEDVKVPTVPRAITPATFAIAEPVRPPVTQDEAGRMPGTARAGLTSDDLARLRQVLDDLVECERVLQRLRPDDAAGRA